MVPLVKSQVPALVVMVESAVQHHRRQHIPVPESPAKAVNKQAVQILAKSLVMERVLRVVIVVQILRPLLHLQPLPVAPMVVLVGMRLADVHQLADQQQVVRVQVAKHVVVHKQIRHLVIPATAIVCLVE